MSIRFVDDKCDGRSPIEDYFFRRWMEDEKKKEEDAKKSKEKKKGPKMVTIGYCLLILMAAAPFVGMFMSALLLSVYVKWAAFMKALATQL